MIKSCFILLLFSGEYTKSCSRIDYFHFCVDYFIFLSTIPFLDHFFRFCINCLKRVLNILFVCGIFNFSSSISFFILNILATKLKNLQPWDVLKYYKRTACAEPGYIWWKINKSNPHSIKQHLYDISGQGFKFKDIEFPLGIALYITF